jgi:hypothetical protein
MSVNNSFLISKILLIENNAAMEPAIKKTHDIVTKRLS